MKLIDLMSKGQTFAYVLKVTYVVSKSLEVLMLTLVPQNALVYERSGRS